MVEECKFGNVMENPNNNGAYERNLARYLHFKFIVSDTVCSKNTFTVMILPPQILFDSNFINLSYHCKWNLSRVIAPNF